jgi:hypothetical protein
MVETRRRFPSPKRVATGAVQIKLSAMLVLMTGNTLLRQAQERSVPVFDLEGTEFFRRDKLLAMALLASQVGVFCLQEVAGLVMVKCIPATGPGNNIERTTHMLRVATNAILSLIRHADHLSVVAASLGQPVLNLAVAVQTFELRASSSYSVARRALG